MQSYLLVLFFLSAVFAVYPMTFPTTPVGTTILTGSTPMGMTYWAGNGGGYFISTVGSSSISWLSTTGSWSPNVFSDSDLLKAAFTGYGVTVSDYYTDDMLLVARTNATGGIPQAALTAFSLGATTWGNKLWTLDLGNGFAKDVAVSESGYAYVTDAKMGQIWEVSLSLTAPTFTMLTNDTVFAASNPASQFSLGVSGVRVVPGGGYLVAGIIEPGISRTRLYCVNIGSSNYGTVTPITFTNAAAYPLMDTTPVDGLDFYPVPSSATTSALGFGAAPAVSGIITPVGGDFCAAGTTYMISKLANNTATITAMNTYTATVWNCDFEVMVSLGSSLAAVTGGVNPPSYAVWVNNGTLPYEPATNFAPGWDCSTAIPIVPNAVSMYYDMYCFRGSRVTIPSSSSCGTGFGIWFKVNVTGMTGGLTFTTRTAKTQFDNYITLYSGCPTYCDTVPSSPKIACSDDNSLPGECSASSTSYCAAYDVPDVSLYKEVYAVINFFSAPTIGACVAGKNFFTTFAAVTSGTSPVAPVAPFPPRVCDPCVPTPTPAPTPTPTPAPAPGDSSSACATTVF